MIFIVFFIFLVICLALFAISDYVLYVQHERHFESWEADGKPYGIFYIPKEAKGILGAPKLASWVSSQRRHLYLAFSTPDWTKTEPRIRQTLVVYRCLLFAGLLCWAIFAALNILKRN